VVVQDPREIAERFREVSVEPPPRRFAPPLLSRRGNSASVKEDFLKSYVNFRFGLVMIALILTTVSASQRLPDAVSADSKHYKVEFENDIVRVLRVRLDAGDSTPRHSHSAYCAIELSDSTLKEPDRPASDSRAGEVFCGDATSHAPQNVGKALAESIVVEFKNRQTAR